MTTRDSLYIAVVDRATTPTVGDVTAHDASAPSGGGFANFKFANNGRVFLRLTNPDVAPHTVTVRGVDGADDKAYVLAASDKLIVGPFTRSKYNQSNGTVNVDVSDGQDDGVTVAAFRF